MNWAPYAVYNPQLWHWPETGPGVAVAHRRAVHRDRLRDVLPRPVLPGDLDPAPPAGRRPVESFVWRHPLVSLAA